MALFQFRDEYRHPVLTGRKAILRPGRMEDFEAWAELRFESQAFLRPWEPEWPEDDLTRGAFRARIRRAAREISADEAYPLFIFRTADGRLVGGLTIGLIRRGVSQACTLGYWMGEPYAGRGFMSDAVRTASTFIFGELGLSRIEAACLPRNERSIRLLEHLGFQREGAAQGYLKINGAWEDHLLYALLAPARR